MIKLLFVFLAWSPSSSDSLRLETVNGKQFIIHQIDAKETLYSISRRYGVPVTAILESNPDSKEGLGVGKLLKVPYTPKPKKKDIVGRAVLHNYAPVSVAYGFHFGAYDKDIFTPVIRAQMRNSKPENKNHYTVYLPAYSDEKIIKVLGEIKKINWQVFSKHTKKEYTVKNIHIRPINNEAFIDSFINCTGVLCGAGFETPAEALFLKKKLMVIPMKGQYEQQCNAAALKTMRVPVIKRLKKKHLDIIKDWVATDQQIMVNYPDTTQRIINMVIKKHGQTAKKKTAELGEGVYSIKKLKEKSLGKILNQLAD